MTIRFIKSWNGYYEGQIVTNPSGGNSEATLIALGYAVADLNGPDNGLLPVMASTNLTGVIKNLQASGQKVSIVKKPSNLVTRIPGGALAATAGTVAGTTWHVTAEMPSQFDWVQLIYRSIEAAPIVLTAAAVGVNDGSVSFPGISGSLSAVTFGGSAKGTIPARVAAGVPSYLFSDWVQVKSLPRTSGGTLPLVIARTYVASPDGSGAGSGYSYSTRMTGGTMDGLYWGQSHQPVDGITTPGSYTNANPSANGLLQGIRVMAQSGACTVAFVGDSVQAGQNSTGGLKSAGFLACLSISNPEFPVIYSGDSAWNGGSPSLYWQIFNTSVQSVKPRIAFYSVSSQNESVTTQVIQDKHYAYAMRFVQDCYDNNVIPVLQTCFPQNRGSTVLDAFRKELNARVKAFADASQGVYLCDADLAVADPSAPYQYLPAYDSGDHSHMTDAGYEAAAVPMIALLKQIVGL